MKLFFLRHGEAGTASHDDLRELTERGRHEVTQVVLAQQMALAAVKQVLVSPIVRAQQTAQLACVQASLSLPCHTVAWLIHETPLSVALAELRQLDKPTLLVGHQPLAGAVVASLTGERVPIGTGHLVEMEGDAFTPGFVKLIRHSQP